MAASKAMAIVKPKILPEVACKTFLILLLDVNLVRILWGSIETMTIR